MQATFGTVSKRRNSTKQLTGGTAYDVVLKEGCGVLNPRIALKWNGTTAPTAYNACTISSWGRQYWVDNWTYEDRQWVASCSVDVLASYKTEIGASSRFVLRAASDQNYHALDRLYPALSSPTCTNVSFSLPHWATTYSGGTFVVGIIGQGNTFSSGGIIYVMMDAANFETMITNCFIRSMNEWSGMGSSTDFATAMKEFGQNLLKSVTNPFDYINSVKWFPFGFSAGSSGTVKLGRIDTGATATAIANPLISENVETAAFSVAGTFDWEKMEPYCTYDLVFPPFGSFRLDSRKMIGATSVKCFIYTDAISGNATMNVVAEVPNQNFKKLMFASAQIGVPVEIAGIQANFQGAISAGATVAAAAAGALAPAAAASGLLAGAASAVGDGWFDVVRTGCMGGVAPVIDPSKYLYITQYSHAPQMPAEFGYPLNDIKTISTLSGFIQCADGDIAIDGTPAEAAEIAGYLTGGFFYE